jgi:hypothetical protein
MWRKDKKMNSFVFSSPTSTPADLFLLPVASGVKRLLDVEVLQGSEVWIVAQYYLPIDKLIQLQLGYELPVLPFQMD